MERPSAAAVASGNATARTGIHLCLARVHARTQGHHDFLHCLFAKMADRYPASSALGKPYLRPEERRLSRFLSGLTKLGLAA
nr:unnamed protein product [Digitaria exilis]